MTQDAKRILIVEDDEAIATGLALNLKIEGYESTVVHDGEAALARVANLRPDLIVLDISLPKKNGLEVLAELRRTGDTTPIVVLSARQDEYDKVAALRLGADDYVTKPFALAELLARIAAVLRRMRGGQSSPSLPGGAGVRAEKRRVHRFGDVVVDLDMRAVTRGGRPVDLTHLEFELLAHFLQNERCVFSREQILRRVWGVDAGSPRTVDNFVGQLRAKLEVDPDRPRHFVTIRGSGYRFDP